MSEEALIIDFVAHGKSESEWRLVLVEEGPWTADEIDQNLIRIQNRLYNCLDASLDGQVASKFPKLRGKEIVIELHGYNLPEIPLKEFFTRFSVEVLQTPDYSSAVKSSAFVSSIRFGLDLEKLA